MKIVAAVTGGATGIFGHYLAQGGKSANFLEGIIPYSTKSTDLFLGYPPDNYCSALTARQLAMRSYERVGTLAPESNEDERVGIGISASLIKVAKERSERKNKLFIARQTKGLTECIEIHLNKLKLWSRSMQESALSHWLSFAFDNDLRYVNTILEKYRLIGRIDHLEYTSSAFFPIIYDPKDTIYGSGDIISARGSIIVPGSFNPVHSGHSAIVQYLRNHYPNKSIVGELSVVNVDKVSLDAITLEERMKHINESKIFDQLIVTKAAKFSEKFKLFTHTIFVMGADTYIRLYERNPYMWDQLEQSDNKILVVGRVDKSGKVITMEYPTDKRHLLTFADDWDLVNISSSQIRKESK